MGAADQQSGGQADGEHEADGADAVKGFPVLGLGAAFGGVGLAVAAQHFETHGGQDDQHDAADEVDRVVSANGQAGKRLDFLMQELNREANTLDSKSVSAEVSAIAMELKLLIEQIREQVQNIE